MRLSVVYITELADLIIIFWVLWKPRSFVLICVLRFTFGTSSLHLGTAQFWQLFGIAYFLSFSLCLSSGHVALHILLTISPSWEIMLSPESLTYCLFDAVSLSCLSHTSSAMSLSSVSLSGILTVSVASQLCTNSSASLRTVSFGDYKLISS